MNYFSGKVALVTGGARGIGATCVEEFLKNGVRGVVIADINSALGEETSKQFNEKYGDGKTIFVNTNVADQSSFEGAFQKAVEVYGNIDILINNAGVFDEIKWNRVIEINLLGTTYGCLLAINNYFPKYRSSPQTFIINVASLAGLFPVEYCPHYTSSKFAITGMSRSFGSNAVIKRDGITVMCLCPGVTDTPIFDVFPVIYKELSEGHLDNAIHQKPDSVAKSIIHMIENPEGGTVWTIEEDVLRKLILREMADAAGAECSYSKTF